MYRPIATVVKCMGNLKYCIQGEMAITDIIREGIYRTKQTKHLVSSNPTDPLLLQNLNLLLNYQRSVGVVDF